MTRKEIYAELEKYNLKEAVKSEYSKNYTNIPNYILEEFLQRYLKNNPPKTQWKEVKEDTIVEDKEQPINKTSEGESKEDIDKEVINEEAFTYNVIKAFLTLVAILKNSHILLPSEVIKIQNTLLNKVD